MLRVHSQRFHSLLVSLDVALSGALLLGLLSVPTVSGLKQGDDWMMTPGLLATSLAACLAWPTTLQHLGLYDSQRLTSLERVLSRLVMAGAFATLLVTATAFVTKAPVGPRFPLLFGGCQLLLLASERLVIFAVLRVVRRVGHNTRNLLVVGSGERAAGVLRTVQQHPEWGLRVVGFVDEVSEPLCAEIPAHLLHKLADLQALLHDEVIDEVMVATPRSLMTSVLPVVSACGATGVPFTLLADIFGDYLPPPAVTRFGSLAALRFATVQHNPASLAVKRAVDVVVATVGLVLTAPVVGALALLIRATSPGAAIFRQIRCGLHGRRFEMLKLRTMCDGAEELREKLEAHNEMNGPAFKMRDDPRVTSVGRWLRRYSLDELPQLWNVLRGEMSLVGPRPPLPHEVAQYETFERRRLSMRPGITCLWQVSGRNEVSDFDEWVRLDLEYIDTWSLGADARILLKTIPAVLRGSGA